MTDDKTKDETAPVDEQLGHLLSDDAALTDLVKDAANEAREADLRPGRASIEEATKRDHLRRLPDERDWASCLAKAKGTRRHPRLADHLFDPIRASQQYRCASCLRHESAIGKLEASHLIAHHEAVAMREWEGSTRVESLARQPENFVGECRECNARHFSESFGWAEAIWAWRPPYSTYRKLRPPEVRAILRVLMKLDEIRPPVHRIRPAWVDEVPSGAAV